MICGGGTVNPDFKRLILEKDTTANSPRNVMNNFYFKPPFKVSPELEEEFVQGMISTRVGEDFYPGDFTTVKNWPNVAPGTKGINNAMAPIYLNLGGFAAVKEKPPVLWVRVDSDQIVSDTSFFDMGYLGTLGFIPGYPGEDIFPPQPMVSQMRYVLDAHAKNGGCYKGVVIENAGHSPFIEN